MDTTITNRKNKTFTSRHHEKYPRALVWSRFPRKLQSRVNSRKVSVADITFCENARDFSEKTTLHALRFVGDPNISIFERLFFLAAFIIALYVALNFIYNIYTKWSLTPVIIANSATNTYISQIPFPAVTVCNMNQALKSKVKHIDSKNPDYQTLQTLCFNSTEFVGLNTTSTRWRDFEEILFNITQPCSRMLIVCRFASQDINCTEFFKPILTDEGRCCTFNTVHPTFMYKNIDDDRYFNTPPPEGHIPIDWTPEFGYPKDLPEKYYPKPASGTGYSMGLTLILDAEVHEYFCSSTNGAGFKVLLHNPTEIPNVGNNGISLQAGHETRVVITPKISVASVALHDMSRSDRQCLFASETNLSYFRTYSVRNCALECEARLMADECNCIAHFMPRISQDIAICNAKDTKCFSTIFTRTRAASNDKNNCSEECISSCFDLGFDSETYSAPINHGNFTIREEVIEKIPVEYVATNIAVVHFYYLENAFRSRSKEQFVGFTDVLCLCFIAYIIFESHMRLLIYSIYCKYFVSASIGGLMGLFIGFSIVSVIEIIYYATFRPFFAKRRFKMKQKPTTEETSKQNINGIIPFGNVLRESFRTNIEASNQLQENKFRRRHGFNTGNESLYNRRYLP